MKKKAIPLAVTKALLQLEGIIKDKGIRIVNKVDNNLMNLECNFIDQKFFFTVANYGYDANKKVLYEYSFMPANEQTFDPAKSKTTFENLTSQLKRWLSLLNGYHEIETPFEDKFQKFYEEQFSERFKIIDEDADTALYDISTQKKLHDFLNQVVLYLEEHKSEETKEQFEIIVEESKELQKELSTSVKSRVSKKFISILAKLWKLGVAVFEGALGNFAYETIKKLLLGG